MKFKVETLNDKPFLVFIPENQAEEQQINYIHTALRTHKVLPTLIKDNSVAVEMVRVL